MTPIADQSDSAEQQPDTPAQRVPWGTSAWAAGTEIASRAVMKGE